MAQTTQFNALIRAGSLDDLRQKGRLLVKAAGRQIAIFQIPGGGNKIYACANRCPHEGYPLIEGSINAACELTCNWHNWKFDLASGRTLTGGDQLRRYPVVVDGDDVLLDLSDPPRAERVAQILDNLTQAMPEHEYDRIAREIARLIKVGGDPLDAVRAAIHYSHDRFEYGSGHAFAATADWLGVYKNLRAAVGPNDRQAREKALVPLFESIGHMAWDTLRQGRFHFCMEQKDWDTQAFAEAIEAQDEDTAVACLRGALDQGASYEALQKSFIKAALGSKLVCS